MALATGPLPPAPLPGSPSPPDDRQRWIDDPWRDPWQSRLRSDSRVVIIGSGLSMVDHLLHLQRAGVRGPVTALSRHGLLPRPQLARRGPAHRCSEKLYAAIAGGQVGALMAALRDECDASPCWQSVIDAFRAEVPAAWRALPVEERRRFLRHLRPWWEVHRHRLAPVLAGRIEQWIESGWLEVMPGRLLVTRCERDALALTVRPRGCATPIELQADLVLRATGVEGSYRRGAVPAIDPLVDAGLLQADPLGLGFAVDAGGRALGRSGAPTPGLHILGAAARGHHFEATAVPELRLAARKVAVDLCPGAIRRRETEEAGGSVT